MGQEKIYNMVFMPNGLMIWKNVVTQFHDENIIPKIWIGDFLHEKIYGGYAGENFLNCEIVDYGETHTYVGNKFSKHQPNLRILQSKFFYLLKDQVYKMMDRQDQNRVFGRLERESFFYANFLYF